MGPLVGAESEVLTVAGAHAEDSVGDDDQARAVVEGGHLSRHGFRLAEAATALPPQQQWFLEQLEALRRE
ncbi:hypothetical protein [Streptomyces sp. NBC_01367]|uniref:hypothetical protein n=1 Tax=Streptomyces sp. NBC_01367 TaxID=2903841 RepID=UPI003255B040